MRFPQMFRRWKGAAQPANIPILIGGDSVPVPTPANVGTTRVSPPASNADNVLFHKISNINGWPCHRVAFVYDGSKVNTPVDVTVAAHVYDFLTERWYRIHAAATVTVKPGVVAFFDTLGLVEVAATGKLPEGANTEAVMFIVTDPGAIPDGEHIFAMGPDLTTIGM